MSENTDAGEDVVEIYSDGACRGNPGPGGWGVVLRYRRHEKTLAGSDAATTNNRMELMAAIMGLESLKRPSRVRLTTDSQYVCNGLRRWLRDWKRRNWRTADRKPVKNEDLWRRLDAAAARHQVGVHWVRGHSGHPGNEHADQLANEAIERMFMNNGTESS